MPPGRGEHVEYFVYVLISFDRHGYRTYVGWTLDPCRRLAEHNAGTGARSTRGRRWFLVHVERHASKREAMSREWQLKRDRKFRKQLAESALPADASRACASPLPA